MVVATTLMVSPVGAWTAHRFSAADMGPALVSALTRGTVQGHCLRLYWHRRETRANLGGGREDVPTATVVAWARGRCARRAGGRADASDGRVFPYVFPAPGTWWSQNTAKLRFIGQQLGGMDRLKGRKIAHVYLDNDFGRATLPILDTQAAHYGFAVQHLAVPLPGLDQRVTWLRVKVAQPDWVLLGIPGGVGLSTALQEAAQMGVPRDKMVGLHPTCSEQDMMQVGDAASASSAPPGGARGPTSRSFRRC